MKVKSEREVAQSLIAFSGGSTTYLLLFLWGFKENPCKTLYRGPSVIYWRRQWHPTAVLMPGKSMDGGAWWAAVHGVARVWHDWATSLSLLTFMHWRRKWQPTPVFLPGESQVTGEPGGLPSMGSHRVVHDWSGLAAAAAMFYTHSIIVNYYGCKG